MGVSLGGTTDWHTIRTITRSSLLVDGPVGVYPSSMPQLALVLLSTTIQTASGAHMKTWAWPLTLKRGSCTWFLKEILMVKEIHLSCSRWIPLRVRPLR